MLFQTIETKSRQYFITKSEQTNKTTASTLGLHNYNYSRRVIPKVPRQKGIFRKIFYFHLKIPSPISIYIFAYAGTAFIKLQTRALF